jgi:hypothetical protein
MVVPNRPPANGFVRTVRKVYNPLGFANGYNFVLFVIFAGAFFAFGLARTPYLNFYNQYCSPGNSPTLHAAPGECFNYFSRDYERVGIIMHLATVIPCALLVVFQFVPAIRHNAIIVHRVNGYLVVILAILGTASALMISRHAFGGTMATQLYAVFLAVAFIGSLLISYINIKRLQIEEHRAWMLRAWFYVSHLPQDPMPAHQKRLTLIGVVGRDGH